MNGNHEIASPGFGRIAILTTLLSVSPLNAGTTDEAYFVNLHDNASAPPTLTVNPPAGGGFGAAAPVVGTVWNNLPFVTETVNPPGNIGNPNTCSNPGTYTCYPADRVLADPAGNTASVGINARVNYSSTSSRGISRISQTSASYGCDPLELMGRAWNFLRGKSGPDGRFSFTQSADANGQNYLNGFQLMRLTEFTWDPADGFGAAATGGATGQTVTVTTSQQLISYATSVAPCTILVSGTIDVTGGQGLDGKSVKVKSNKTIQGADSSAKIIGCLDLSSGGVDNVIIRNLNLTHPGSIVDANGKYSDGGDGITVNNATNVFVTHCSFVDCADGSCDISHDARYVTVSWCKFSYTAAALVHRFSMILGNTDTTTGPDYFVTLHHNWWAERCDQRMPSGSYSTAHIYNNYFSCGGNSYCTNARTETEFLVQGNYYNGVKNPCYKELGGKMFLADNLFVNCTGYPGGYDSTAGTVTGNDTVFSPPYTYQADNAADVPAIVMARAGVTTPPVNGWASWQNCYFTASEITAGIAEDPADPDSDRLSNLAEYALGTDPRHFNPLPLPHRDASGFALVFTRPAALPGISYFGESSETLGNWLPVALEVIQPGNPETVRIRDPLTSGNPSRRFLRLRFTRD